MANARHKAQDAQREQAASPAEGTMAKADEQPEVPFKEQVRVKFQAGATRKQIADEYGVSYQRIFALTKDLTVEGAAGGGRARVNVEQINDKDGNPTLPEEWIGKPRVDVIRDLYENGNDELGIEPGKAGPISRLLGTSYQVVFQATKSFRAGADADEAEDADTEDGVDEGDLEEDEDTEDEDE